METINYANVCRLCLTEVEHCSEPLSNCVDNVLLVFRLEVFLDDGFPQQVCPECSHTLMITAKLRDTVYETDMLLKTYHKTDNKPDLNNDELNETANPTNNINNAIHSIEYVNVKNELLDVKFNCTDSNDSTTLVMNSRPIIKSEARVVLKKLPYYISKTSLIYCSICLLAFKDSEQFRRWKHTKSLHQKNRRNIIENDCRLQNDKDELILAVEKRLEYSTKISKERQKKNKEHTLCQQSANVTEEQRKKKIAEYHRVYRANFTEEQRNKYLESQRKYRANKTEEQRKKIVEYQRKKYLERKRKKHANLTKEQK